VPLIKREQAASPTGIHDRENGKTLKTFRLDRELSPSIPPPSPPTVPFTNQVDHGQLRQFEEFPRSIDPSGRENIAMLEGY